MGNPSPQPPYKVKPVSKHWLAIQVRMTSTVFIRKARFGEREKVLLQMVYEFLKDVCAIKLVFLPPPLAPLAGLTDINYLCLQAFSLRPCWLCKEACPGRFVADRAIWWRKGFFPSTARKERLLEIQGENLHKPTDSTGKAGHKLNS